LVLLETMAFLIALFLLLECDIMRREWFDFVFDSTWKSMAIEGIESVCGDVRVERGAWGPSGVVGRVAGPGLRGDLPL
jgi:hypothetical protein